MLAILPADPETNGNWLTRLGLVDGQCLIADERDNVLGIIAYLLDGDTVKILHLEGDDPGIVDGLLRACLNKTRHKGAETACCSLPEWEPMLKKMGFSLENDGYRMKVSEFFNKNACQHG